MLRVRSRADWLAFWIAGGLFCVFAFVVVLGSVYSFLGMFPGGGVVNILAIVALVCLAALTLPNLLFGVHLNQLRHRLEENLRRRLRRWLLGEE